MSNEFCVPTYDLTGKVALVTGGTRGIGYGIAAAFAAAGAAVVITSRKPADCAAVQKEFEDKGYKALGVAIDVSETEKIPALVEQIVQKFGHLDILVNNAGIGGVEKPILDINEDEWDQTHNINLKGAYFCAKAVAAQIKKQGTGGRIINLGSAAGIIAPKYTSVYAATKSAMIHLTKIMANEWARYGINVNAIAPGYIITEMTKGVMEDEKNANAVMKKIALRRFGDLSDVAGVALFLSSEGSKYLTGVLIPIDGGMTIS